MQKKLLILAVLAVTWLLYSWLLQGMRMRVFLNLNRGLKACLITLFLLFVGEVKGQDFIWAKGVGGIGSDFAGAMATDENENVYFVGDFYKTIVFNDSVTINSNSSSHDIFIVKYDKNGKLKWVRRAGGSGVDNVQCIAIKGGAVYVGGSFEKTMDFNTPSNMSINTITAQENIFDFEDGFIAKYDTLGNFYWAKRMGGVLDDSANGIIASNEAVYVTGSFNGGIGNFSSPYVKGQNEIAGLINDEIFLAKYNADGDFQWAKRGGGTGSDKASGITLSEEFLYIVGSFDGSANFNTPSNIDKNVIISAGQSDIFIAKYNTDGDFQWAKRGGGLGSDLGFDIAVSDNGVYIAGLFEGHINYNTPSNFGTNELVSQGFYDGYITKYDINGDFQWAKRVGGGLVMLAMELKQLKEVFIFRVFLIQKLILILHF